jgi:hypothetical protein
MSNDNQYASFVKAFLSRGAVGLAVGFASVAPTAAKELPTAAGEARPHSFADRLAAVQAAVSEHTKSHKARTYEVAWQNFSNFNNFSNFSNAPKWINRSPN